MLPEKMREIAFLHYLIKDIWCVLYIDRHKQYLIPEAKLFYPIRTAVTETITKTYALQKTKFKLTHHEKSAYICANEIVAALLAEAMKDINEEIVVKYLQQFTSQTIERLFSNEGQTLTESSKRLATAQAVVTKYFRRVLVADVDLFSQLIEKAIKKGLMATTG